MKLKNNICIALDAFGSDDAPQPEVEGAVQAIKENVCDQVILVGNKEIIQKELEKYFYPDNRIVVEHASQVIEMGEKASAAVRTKKDSSLVRAVELHKNKKAHAMVSAGNTGAVMSASLFAYGRIKNVMRPAIAIAFPTQKNPQIVLDVGANVDCTPDHLTQFAELGSIYFEFLFQKKKPRIALLNIGEEDQKGNSLTKAVYNNLAELSTAGNINFVGNIEGKDILKGNVDVVVCDGFVGNIMLKTVEGVAISLFDMMKEQFKKDWVAKLGALLSFPVYSYMKKKMDHSEYGGALLVGLNGISIIGHGRSNAKAIKNAIRFATKIASSDFISSSQAYFERK